MKNKLKLRRVEINRKQKDVAKDVGISQQYLCNLENGITNNPNLEIMQKLAEALNTTVEYLFFDNNK